MVGQNYYFAHTLLHTHTRLLTGTKATMNNQMLHAKIETVAEKEASCLDHQVAYEHNRYDPDADAEGFVDIDEYENDDQVYGIISPFSKSLREIFKNTHTLIIVLIILYNVCTSVPVASAAATVPTKAGFSLSLSTITKSNVILALALPNLTYNVCLSSFVFQ